MVTLEMAKAYLNIDYNDDDVIISFLIKCAEIYLKNAGVKVDEKSELYSFLICLWVFDRYENRDKTKPNLDLSNLITQMRLQNV